MLTHFAEAAFGGQLALCTLLIDRYNAQSEVSTWDAVLAEAAAGGHVAIMDLALKSGAKDVQRFVFLFFSCCVYSLM